MPESLIAYAEQLYGFIAYATLVLFIPVGAVTAVGCLLHNWRPFFWMLHVFGQVGKYASILAGAAMLAITNLFEAIMNFFF